MNFTGAEIDSEVLLECLDKLETYAKKTKRERLEEFRGKTSKVYDEWRKPKWYRPWVGKIKSLWGSVPRLPSSKLSNYELDIVRRELNHLYNIGGCVSLTTIYSLYEESMQTVKKLRSLAQNSKSVLLSDELAWVLDFKPKDSQPYR